MAFFHLLLICIARTVGVRDCNWQQNVDLGPLSWSGLNSNLTAALLNDSIHSGKPEPGAASHLFGCIERLKGMQARLFIHANARIANAYGHVSADSDCAGR